MCKELIENIGEEPQHPKSAMYAAALSAVPLIGMGVVVNRGTIEVAQTTFWAFSYGCLEREPTGNSTSEVESMSFVPDEIREDASDAREE